ncbi:glycosyltransferase family 4 protein [Mycobacterium deserti]|uniref:Glycosyltransferase family 4 protein n=1 Tax=Mycobacterium deserti TaxID=2978347 RepID=A0ABT2MDX9_9MYCO|nr:glycosyltransferase family 4 protein [Mycobacterium deserti]MCT7660161.1 glycosyltransferase family 4 protein [Mycobacterium deserti]
MLWLSPWMRPLARVHVEALRRRNVEVLLVTSDQHPESDSARDYEIVLDPRVRTASTWAPTAAAWWRIRQWRPSVVVTEIVRDPRWIALAGLAPRVELVHDDREHDPDERRPRFEQAVFDRWGARAKATVAFSDHVAAALRGRPDVRRTPVHTVPLTSDLDQALVPAPEPAAARRDFVLVGRLNPYKNIDVVLEAWRAHTAGRYWRGDELVLLGDGDALPAMLPKHVVHRAGGYRYRDVVSTIAAAKGSVALYRRASQSGVQVLSMQLGVTPIVSPVGALPEFQPPGCDPIGIDDVDGLIASFDRLADPEVAARDGADAAQHYADGFTADHAAGRLLDVLLDVVVAAS